MAEWTSVVERTMARQGWEYIRDNGHRVWKKGGMTVSLPKTPSDVRGMRNTMANLKQKGVVFTTERRRRRVVPDEQMKLSERHEDCLICEAGFGMAHKARPKPIAPPARALLPPPTALTRRQIYVASASLTGALRPGETSNQERHTALGKAALRWLRDKNMVTQFVDYLSSLEPDGETLYAQPGYPCRYPDCDVVKNAPAARGLHERGHIVKAFAERMGG